MQGSGYTVVMHECCCFGGEFFMILLPAECEFGSHGLSH